MCIWLMGQFTLYSHETSGVTASNPPHISQIYKLGWVRADDPFPFCNLPPSLPLFYQFAVFWCLSLSAESCTFYIIIWYFNQNLMVPPPSYWTHRWLLCSLPLSVCLWGRSNFLLPSTTLSASQHFPSCPCHNRWVSVLPSLMWWRFLFILALVPNLNYY